MKRSNISTVTDKSNEFVIRIKNKYSQPIDEMKRNGV